MKAEIHIVKSDWRTGQQTVAIHLEIDEAVKDEVLAIIRESITQVEDDLDGSKLHKLVRL